MLPQIPHKLGPRSTPCVFLGYHVDHRGFRCLDRSNNHIILSRHMIFDGINFPLLQAPQQNRYPNRHSSMWLPFRPLLHHWWYHQNYLAPPRPQDPPPAPIQVHNPAPTHPMTTRSKSDMHKPVQRLCLHITTVSPLPVSHVQEVKDPY